MSSAAFCFLTLFSGIIVQMFFRISGIYLPATTLCVFYLAVAYGPRIGVLCGLAAGIVIFCLCGAVNWDLLLIPPAIALLGAWWPHHSEVQHPLRSFLPGICVASVTAFISLIQVADFGSLGIAASYLALAAISGGILLPTIVWGLDKIAKRCGTPMYQAARIRIMKQDR